MTVGDDSCQGILVSVCPCPVCGSFAPVLVLVRLDEDEFVYFCPGCETAWPDAPVFPVLDQVHSLDELAPKGVRLPTKIETLELESKTPVRYDTWREELDRVLRGRPH